MVTPMRKVQGPRIHAQIEDTDLQRLEKVMKRHKLTRSEALRNMLCLGLDVYEDSELFGIPQTVAVFDGMKGQIESFMSGADAQKLPSQRG